LWGYQKRLTDPHALDQLRRNLIPGTKGQVFLILSILSPEGAALSIDTVRPACRESISASTAESESWQILDGSRMPSTDSGVFLRELSCVEHMKSTIPKTKSTARARFCTQNGYATWFLRLWRLTKSGAISTSCVGCHPARQLQVRASKGSVHSKKSPTSYG